jgi:hypothetical protein
MSYRVKLEWENEDGSVGAADLGRCKRRMSVGRRYQRETGRCRRVAWNSATLPITEQ